MGLVRLQKVLAQKGFGSRRGSELLITEGKVRVNGERVWLLGTRVDPERDHIEVDPGVRDAREQTRKVVVLNKPVGYVTTKGSSEGPGVMDLLEGLEGKSAFNPVGRLDKDSSGLLLLTNDGLLQYAIVDPQRHVEKEYEVRLTRPALPSQLQRMREGMVLEGHPLRSCVVEAKDSMTLRIILTEGRNRQIRKMVAKIGIEVMRLERKRIGPVELGGLAVGSWRELGRDEIVLLEVATERST